LIAAIADKIGPGVKKPDAALVPEPAKEEFPAAPYPDPIETIAANRSQSGTDATGPVRFKPSNKFGRLTKPTRKVIGGLGFAAALMYGIAMLNTPHQPISTAARPAPAQEQASTKPAQTAPKPIAQEPPASTTQAPTLAIIEPEMKRIEPGQFQMGSGEYPSEKPVHLVNYTKPFAIGRYEMTFEQYDQYAQDQHKPLPDDHGWGRGKRPVINVSWNDAVAYAQWLSEKTHKRYRLPTEAEWEYAARSGSPTRYWWGDDISQGRANCEGCGSQWDNKQTAPVGSFPANAWGLHDTAGNVWEWVMDNWHDNYQGAPADNQPWLDPSGTASDGRRVIRGGSWFHAPDTLRSATRSRLSPGYRDVILGFRLAQDL
jgi:formylglycine-generating enzyme required for sulfatase activity